MNRDQVQGCDIQGPLSVLYNQIHRYTSTEARERLHLCGGEIVDASVANISNEIYADVIRSISDEDIEKLKEIESSDQRDSNYYYYKSNHYNLNLLCESYKIKVYLGINARVARENYNIVAVHFAEYHRQVDPVVVDTGLYRIEIYKRIQGYTIADLINVDIIINDNSSVLLDFIIDNYYSKLHDNKVVFPNDNNPGNFIATDTGLVNIDYDHITNCSYQQMIHTVALQFYADLYDIERYPDSEVAPWVIRLRETDLFQQITNFQIEFYKRINDTDSIEQQVYNTFKFEEDRFRHSDYLYNLIYKYNKEHQ